MRSRAAAAFVASIAIGIGVAAPAAAQLPQMELSVSPTELSFPERTSLTYTIR